MRPIPADEFSSLVASIYDCALDPGLWQQTLEEIRLRANFLSATIAVVEVPGGQTLINVASGVDDDWLAAMSSFGRDIMDQWGGAERVSGYPLDVPMVLSEVNPWALTVANRYHREICVPRGVVDSLSVGLLRDARAFGAVTCMQHESAGVIDTGQIELMRLFVPHLKRAVTISRLLEANAVERATFASVLDGLSVAVLLVGPDLRLRHANRAGEAALRTGDPLGLRLGRVTAPPALAAALAAAMGAPLDGIGRRGLGIPARRLDGEALVIHVLPLIENPLPGAAALFVAPATAPSPAPVAAIAALFGLTPTETRVLALIGFGRTNAEAAAALGIAPSTLHTHLLRIFEKTRTHRQAELVSLIAGFSLPLA